MKVEWKRLLTENGDRYRQNHGIRKRRKLYADSWASVAKLYATQKGKYHSVIYRAKIAAE